MLVADRPLYYISVQPLVTTDLNRIGPAASRLCELAAMFATLQYSLEDDEMTCAELTDKIPSLNQPFSHSACSSCRDKKVC